MNADLILFARSILTLDKPRPLEDGFVAVKGDRILQVGRRKDLYARPKARVLDLGDTLLLPGLINAHCHLDFTAFKGRVPYRGNFREWLREMAGKTRGTTLMDFRRSIRAGIQESLAQGTTTLCDTVTSGESPKLLRDSGLRAFAFLELLDVGRPDPRAVWKDSLERFKALSRALEPSDQFRLGLAPHTPFTVSKELLLLAGAYAGLRARVPTSIHVAESRDEAAFFKKGRGPMAERIKTLNPDWALPHGTTPVRYLNACGWLPKLDLGVHLNVVDGKDLDLLAKNRITVVHCPGSHAFFGHPPFRYEAMRRKGIPVALGTDSLASNRSLSLFREMRLFKEAHPKVSAQEVLAMATLRPARALGEGRRLGRVAPGFFADLIGIRLEKGSRRDPYEQVVANRRPVSFSMIAGKLQWR